MNLLVCSVLLFCFIIYDKLLYAFTCKCILYICIYYYLFFWEILISPFSNSGKWFHCFEFIFNFYLFKRQLREIERDRKRPKPMYSDKSSEINLLTTIPEHYTLLCLSTTCSQVIDAYFFDFPSQVFPNVVDTFSFSEFILKGIWHC